MKTFILHRKLEIKVLHKTLLHIIIGGWINDVNIVENLSKKV